jgi:putative Mn2+ efflux pump MntP
MKKIVLIGSAFLISTFAFGQGCSDAGICSIGNGFQSREKELKNNVEIAAIVGAGESDVSYFSPFLSLSASSAFWKTIGRIIFSFAVMF